MAVGGDAVVLLARFLDGVHVDHGRAEVAQVVQEPDTFYAAAGGRVFKSTDGGKSWRPVGEDLPEGISVVAVAQSDPRIVYAGALSRSSVILFRSGDGSESWEAQN